MPFAPECSWPFEARATLWPIFEKFRLVPPAGFGWAFDNCHNLAIRALLKPLLAPKSSPVLALWVHNIYRIILFAQECFSAYQTRFTFWTIFEKFLLVSPFGLFQKMRVLNDLAKIAITWPFGHVWSRCLRQNVLQCLHIFRKCGFGWPCKNCHNLVIRALLEPPFAPKSFLVFAF